MKQGLGIGLAIARDIVERHGGTIGLDNRSDGPGAVLTISLPLAGGRR
jgi:two-component system OmpR family sensor kinase